MALFSFGKLYYFPLWKGSLGLGEEGLEGRTGSKAECSTSSHLPRFTFPHGFCYKVENEMLLYTVLKLVSAFLCSLPQPPTHGRVPDSVGGNHYTQRFQKVPLDQPGASLQGTESTAAPLTLPKQKWPESKSEIWWKK